MTTIHDGNFCGKARAVLLRSVWRQSQAVRQYSLDFAGRFEPPIMTRAPRLLVMACSATKRQAAGRARDVYDGPLYRTLKSVDTSGDGVFLAVLSAKYGLIDGDASIEPYDAVIDDHRRDEMIAAGPHELYPQGRLDQKTPAGLRAARAKLGPRTTPGSTIVGLANRLGGRFTDIAIVGGRRYLDVASSWLSHGWERSIHPNASRTLINGEIGYMRRDLRAWLERPAPAIE